MCFTDPVATGIRHLKLQNLEERIAVADIHSKILDARPPWSNFLHFQAVFGKIWSNNSLAVPLGLAPQSRKSWILRWIGHAPLVSLDPLLIFPLIILFCLMYHCFLVTSTEKQWAEKKSGNSFDENKPRRFDGMVPVESLQSLDQ